MHNTHAQTAIFAGGCFWCTEATFAMLKGVTKVVPGYVGGTTPNPTYEQVCTGTTGHAEAIRVDFDETIITYHDLLTVFFAVHNPTTPNQQGNDVGTQYRSAIFFTSPEQESEAKAFIATLQENEFKGTEIVTEVQPLDTFYEAEEYHHDYFKKNPDKAYCQIVIDPKVQKMKAHWKHLLK